ncbi:MAG: hypothetical protein KDD89_15755, partial [Anaerolineales bacterium]|nr:hypothetical protein [Anaerolineales bacterium]
MSFEWETEEDHWDDAPPSAPEPPRRRRGRGLLVALFIVGLMTTAVWLVYRQAQNRIETAETAAREEVLTSHN